MKDTFGYALLSYWQGDHKTPHIIKRDDGRINKEGLKHYFEKYAQFSSIEKRALKYAKGKILDVGCGAGRHVLYLQNKGFNILGIDKSPLAIKICKERGCKQVKVMDILKTKIKANTFDTIILFGNNLGIGGNLKGVKKLLKILRGLAKKDGILLLSSIDIKATKDKSHINYQKKNLKQEKYIGILKIRMEYKNLIGDWFNWVMVEPGVLKRLASESGWEVEKIYRGKWGHYAAVLRAS